MKTSIHRHQQSLCQFLQASCCWASISCWGTHTRCKFALLSNMKVGKNVATLAIIHFECCMSGYTTIYISKFYLGNEEKPPQHLITMCQTIEQVMGLCFFKSIIMFFVGLPNLSHCLGWMKQRLKARGGKVIQGGGGMWDGIFLRNGENYDKSHIEVTSLSSWAPHENKVYYPYITWHRWFWNLWYFFLRIHNHW